jgi:quinol monooxygenase YgiN
MAGTVHIPWYATVFRGDKLEAALVEIAPVALRYGASSYALHRNRDDAYKLLQLATFEDKADWERYWMGPEFTRFRAANQSLYQVPALYSWADVVVEGYLDEERVRSDLRAGAGAAGDVL